MATYVLIPGAGGSAWYWHRVVPELRGRGHDVVAVTLPADDDSAGLTEYADAVINAVGEISGLVLVAQSMGAFTAPLVCARAPVDLLVLVNGMIPRPGETAGEWWSNTGQEAAQRDYLDSIGLANAVDDLADLFFHDVPPEIAAEGLQDEPDQSATPFSQPWPLNAWPDVPTKVVIGRDDRLFPGTFQRRVAGERLGIAADEIDGGHLIALSRPRELVERLEVYRRDLESGS
jgi:pimeloyl-ACP methyl ester carboxylesterase